MKTRLEIMKLLGVMKLQFMTSTSGILQFYVIVFYVRMSNYKS